MEQYLDQIYRIIHLCEDTDGIFICDKDGYIEYCRSPLNYYLKPADTVGKHILEVYPCITEETSTILQVLKTGRPITGHRQELVNYLGQRIALLSTTVPIVVDGAVVGVVDSSQFFHIDSLRVREPGDDGLYRLADILTGDPAMLALKRRILDAAAIDSPVLIYGETGTGKELVAQSLHTEGRRAKGPFLSQNCAAIPPNLLESIFFGTEKGSYTGAENRKGLFEVADGGTLFLDEINSMDVGLQAKLLKALEEKKVRHVGGHRDIPFDVRIVCAMNEDPRTVLAEHRVREDLYYRVGVVKLTIPPLRERPGDVALLTAHFMEKFSREMNKRITGLSPLAQGLLEQYPWPGNVRELQNTIESAFNTAKGETLLVEDVRDILSPAAPVRRAAPAPALGAGFSLTRAVDDYERELLRQALEQSASVSEAARLLGLSRQRLQYKMQKFGL